MFKTNIPPPPYSSPSQREGEEIGGGGHFEHLPSTTKGYWATQNPTWFRVEFLLALRFKL